MTKRKVSVNEELPIEQVWDVLRFAQNMSQGLLSAYLTPDLVNARLKDTSYNPVELTDSKIKEALKYPKQSEQSLRELVEMLEIVSSPIKRVFSYLSTQLSFDYTYTCENAESSDYTKPAYKKDEKIFLDFMNNFDYKSNFRNAVKQMLRNESYVCSFRNLGGKFSLQELPLDRVKITGKWANGYLCAFDFYYFLIPGVDVRLYSKFFRDKVNEVFGGGKQTYNPSLPLELRANSQFVYWVDLPPEAGYVFKFDPSMATNIPWASAMLPDFVNQGTMRELQKNINIAEASKLLIGSVPMLENAKASLKDQFSISPDNLGKFIALVKSALSEAIKVSAAPLENIQGVEFSGNDKLYSSYLKTSLAATGLNTAIFYTSDLKANAIESQLSWESDYLMMATLYEQFNNFINYFVNKMTSKYKFRIVFEGSEHYLNRQQRFDYAMDMADRGIVLPQKIAASRGIAPHNLYKMLEEQKAKGFVDMLTPIQLNSQMAAGDDKKGRPSKSDGELSESGSNTRESGSNIEKGGKT